MEHRLKPGYANSRVFWSGRPGSNRRHSAWEADVLPLNYSRRAGQSQPDEVYINSWRRRRHRRSAHWLDDLSL